jgi:predicted nucleotidyltransferase
MISQHQKEIILDHLKSLKPLKAGIFGSYSRGDNKKGSDLDILVFLDYANHRISLLDLVGVEQDLSEALGVKVDLVTEKSLSPHIRPFVEKDLMYIIT